VHTPFWCDAALLRLVGLFLFAHSFLVKREVVLACRLTLGCKVSGCDVLHEREMAQPVLLPAIVDIHNLPRSGFVSTSCFSDLMWGKV
jgi:hypothetical protein